MKSDFPFLTDGALPFVVWRFGLPAFTDFGDFGEPEPGLPLMGDVFFLAVSFLISA